MFNTQHTRAVIRIQSLTKDDLKLLGLKKASEDNSIVTDFLIKSEYSERVCKLLLTKDHSIINFYTLSGDLPPKRIDPLISIIDNFIESLFEQTNYNKSDFDKLPVIVELNSFKNSQSTK